MQRFSSSCWTSQGSPVAAPVPAAHTRGVDPVAVAVDGGVDRGGRGIDRGGRGIDRGGRGIVGRHAPTHFRQAAGGEALAGAAAARCADRRSNQPPEHHRKRGTAPVRRAEENTSSQNAE